MEEGICSLCGAKNSITPTKSINCGRCGHPVYPQNPFYNSVALGKIKKDLLEKLK